MKKISVLLIVLFCAKAMFAQKKTKNRPNIIIFMADDMGFADTGFTGSKDILTPNLDALVTNGVIFKQGYVNHAFCGPSRATLMSGRYPYVWF